MFAYNWPYGGVTLPQLPRYNVVYGLTPLLRDLVASRPRRRRAPRLDESKGRVCDAPLPCLYVVCDAHVVFLCCPFAYLENHTAEPPKFLAHVACDRGTALA